MRSDLALAALASAAVPGMKPVAVAGLALPIEEAPDHQRAVVEDATGRRWLIRSPLSPVAGARLLRNDELIRQLSRHLPFKVPSPVGRAEVGQDGYAVVYPHVEGYPLDFGRLPPGPGLASAIGRAVAAVHNIPRAVFEAQDVPVFDAAGSRQRMTALVDRAAETGRVPTGLLARWEDAFDAAPLWQFATTPTHGAFRGGAVLVAFADEDASSGRVLAITDWEEAMVADPAVDLADLYARTSPATWESVLDSYVLARAQRPDPYLHARARLISETNRLGGLAQAVADEDEERTRHVVEALRRLDRLTEDEDSLVPATARGVRTTAVSVGPMGDTGWTDIDASDSDPLRADLGAEDQMVTEAGSDDDVTAEVPVVSFPDDADEGHQEQASAPVDDAADLDHEDLAPETSGVAGDAEETADDAAEDPDVEVAEEATDEVTVEPDDESVGETDETDETDEDKPTDELAEMDDEERLHELYGMPSPPQQD